MLLAARTRNEVRKANTEAVKRLYERRVDAGQCKHDNGKPPHAPPTKSFRRTDGKPTMCETCHEAKVADTRERRKRARGE